MKNLFKLLFPLTMVSEDGGGSENTDWKTSLPEPVQGWDEVKNSDTPDKFWDQVTNMRSHLGQSIRIPGQDAGDDDWKAFNEKMIAKVLL
jgi:hypothetical protein